MILKNGRESYNNWQKSPAPIYMQFYIFNYTNVDDFMSGKSKPNVKEKGPYSYRSAFIIVLISCCISNFLPKDLLNIPCVYATFQNI